MRLSVILMPIKYIKNTNTKTLNLRIYVNKRPEDDHVMVETCSHMST
jgi:hypothetical protein